MGTVSKLYVSNNTWIYVCIKKTWQNFNSNSNSQEFQLQFQLQLREFQLKLKLRQVSWISTPTPTPTPGVSTPTPTPTPANLQNINSNSNSGGFNSNSNSNSGVGVEPNSNSGVDPNPGSDRTGPSYIARREVQLSPKIVKHPEKRTITVISSPARQLQVDGPAPMTGPAQVMDGPAGNGSATVDGSATMDGSATGYGPATVDSPARPVTARQATVRPVTARRTARPQLIHLTAQLFTLMTRRSRTTLHVIRRWEWTGRQAMEPRHGTTPAGGPDASVLTGTSSTFFPAIRTSINQATLIDFLSMWTLLQRRMDQGMVPDTSASPAVPSSVPAPRQASSSRRSDTQSGTPERRPRTPEPRTPQRYPRTPVRRVRMPVRQARGYSDSRDCRSRSPLSRSSSVESPTWDASPVNFTASMDPDDKRSISDDEGDEGEHKKISAAQYQIFRQAVTTSKGSFKSTPLRQSERPGRLCWT